MPSRPSWDETFIEIAQVLSRRATCSRRKVGAVLVKDNRIISTGYNGAAPGKTHCTDGGCPRGQHFEKYDIRWNGAGHYKVKVCACGQDWPCVDAAEPGQDYNQYPCVAIHAEANALLRAGERAAGAVMYITDKPCLQCSNLMDGAGVKEIIVGDDEWCNNDLPVEEEVIVVQADVSELPALTTPPERDRD